MTDTQWTRFQVFLQEKQGAPHQDVGSVHAPDAEMALFNARDVFVRRPDCVSLWVVPAAAIYSRTAQELADRGFEFDEEPAGEQQAFHAFCKERPAGTQTWLGQVQAASAVEALRKAVDSFSAGRKAYAWWVFPARLVVQSQEDEIESLFAPALDKTFRMPSDYHTVSAMRQIRALDSEAGSISMSKRPNLD